MNSIAAPDDTIAAAAQAAPVVAFEAAALRGEDGAPGPSGLSFALQPASFHVLTGAAGCGKTSVLNLICLAERPAAGRVAVFGRDTATLGRREVAAFRRRIGLVFAGDRLIEHLSVFDNAALVPRLAGRRRRDYAREVAEILAWVGLGRKMDVLPGVLSAGQRRRLAVARAVANRPDLLLADEPTGGLDGEAGLGVLRLLAEINGAGTTVLMTTRDEELATASGAPVLCLRGGRLTRLDGGERAMAS